MTHETVDYKGDHTKALHNRILGPGADGEFYVVTDSTFQNDVTTAQLRPATDDEVENCGWTKDGFRTLAEA
jgi:hypothetical protein